jgi:hypothetical protein
MNAFPPALLVLFVGSGPIAAHRSIEHAKIELNVVSASGQVTAFMDQTPPPSGKNPRPVLQAKVNQRIKIDYMFVNDYPTKTLKDVVIHFYVAPIEKVGQKETPTLSEESLIIETAHDLDLRPGGRTGGRAVLRIDRPGVYLVRVESQNTASDHEHFAAIDLVVTDAG